MTLRTVLAAVAAAAGVAVSAGGCAGVGQGTPDGVVGPRAESAYEWRLPAGFPPPRVPSDNPMSAAKVELGRRLFYDTRLSVTGEHSCASCHRPELAFTDGRARALGATGEEHPRSAMTLTNVAYNQAFNWGDPETGRLEEQMLVPMFGDSPVELGLGGLERALIAELSADPDYPALFAEAFPRGGGAVTIERVVKAIAAFERTLISGGSPYDRWVFWDEREALSPAARRGMKLFFSERTHCSACHAGLNFSDPPAFAGAPPASPGFHNTALYDLDGRGGYPEPNRGVYEHTGEAGDMGRFRAPTLRNVALTAPYMHDGSEATLADVIAFYDRGG
ncbi:MAG: di-heme enzyme, partial [Thermoanaerobaculia bacterium]|nr:di-heme enzyme [Thermoanaerobaculia bacterium]